MISLIRIGDICFYTIYSILIIGTIGFIGLGYKKTIHEGATIDERFNTSIVKKIYKTNDFGVAAQEKNIRAYDRIEITLDKEARDSQISTDKLVVYSIGEDGVVFINGNLNLYDVEELNNSLEGRGIAIKKEYLGEKDYNQIKKYMKDLFGEKWKTPYKKESEE